MLQLSIVKSGSAAADVHASAKPRACRTIGGLQMDIAADLALFRAERDALAFLGLLSSLYLRFDPPISPADAAAAQPTHFQGLNIHALIIDNADGEVLALEHNQIHAHQSPVEHAEQRALRMAIARIAAKRPGLRARSAPPREVISVPEMG